MVHSTLPCWFTREEMSGVLISFLNMVGGSERKNGLELNFWLYNTFRKLYICHLSSSQAANACYMFSLFWISGWDVHHFDWWLQTCFSHHWFIWGHIPSWSACLINLAKKKCSIHLLRFLRYLDLVPLQKLLFYAFQNRHPGTLPPTHGNGKGIQGWLQLGRGPRWWTHPGCNQGMRDIDLHANGTFKICWKFKGLCHMISWRKLFRHFNTSALGTRQKLLCRSLREAIFIFFLAQVRGSAFYKYSGVYLPKLFTQPQWMYCSM